MTKILDCYKPLVGMMAERQMSNQELAKMLGLCETSLYYRLRGIRPFTQSDMAKVKVIFGLSPEKMDDIFLSCDSTKVEKS